MELTEERIDEIQARLGQQLETLAQYVDEWSVAKSKIDQDDAVKRFEAATDLLDRFEELALRQKKNLATEERTNSTSPSAIASKRRKELQKEKGRDSAEKPESHGPQRWQDEVNSWDLLRILSHLQFSKKHKEAKDRMAPRYKIHKYSPDTDLWTQFTYQEDNAREKKLVLEWLERCARDDEADLTTILEQYDQKAGDGETGWAHGWLSTREQIKSHKRLTSSKGATPVKAASLRAKDSTEVLVTQLDPDAPTRQGRKLEAEDARHDHTFWVVCYDMFRRGMSWTEILEWCEERNEGWRAASLGAAQDLPRDQSRLCLAGPYSGALWRRMCYKMAQQVTADRYERATYGLLAGDVASVEPVCRSWTDWLYVNYNAILLGSFEEWLKKHHPERFPSIVSQKHAIYHPVPQQSDDMDTDGIDATLRIIGNEKFADKSRDSVYLLQGALISRSFDRFAANLGIAIAQVYEADENSLLKQAPRNVQHHEYYHKCAQDINTIRVAAHALIIYRDLGFELSDTLVEYADNIILCYINYLRELRKYEAIPTYAKCLSDEDIINTALGRLLFDITEPTEQNQMITLMDQAGLDLVAILIKPYHYALAELGISPEQEEDTPSIDTFHLVDQASDRWAGWRVAKRFDDEDIARIMGLYEGEAYSLESSLRAADLRLVRTMKWFLLVQAPWAVVFSALTNVMEQLLRTDHFFAALAISKALPVSKLSKHLTPTYFNGDAIDVFELGTQGHLQNGHSKGNNISEAEDVPGSEEFEFKVKVEILKSQAKAAKELEELCGAVEQLIVWRLVENNINLGPDQKEAMEITAGSLVDLHHSMRPLLQSFMVPPFHGVADDEQESLYLDPYTAYDLDHIKRAFLPSIVLAYNGAMTFAASLLGPETLYGSLCLANGLAAEENQDLAQTIVAADRMPDVVRSLTISQRTLLKLNQDGEGRIGRAKRGKGSKTSPRKKSRRLVAGNQLWQGETLDIWDVRRRG